jgi:threonyl-tRNA synthetase
MQVREAQLAQFNYILVVGEEEKAAGTVNVRTRDNHVHGQHTLDNLLRVLQDEKRSRSLTSMFGMADGEADGANGTAAGSA